MQQPDREEKQKHAAASPHYVQWGITALCVIAASILLFFLLFRASAIFAFLSKALGTLKPFIYGFVMAYLLLPIFNALSRFFCAHMTGKHSAKLAKGVSSVLSLLFGVLIVVALLWMVIPQLVVSIFSLLESMDSYLQEISDSVGKLFQGNAVIERNFIQLYGQFSDQVINWVENIALPQLVELMTGVVSTVSVVGNWLIGVVIALYILNSKDTFCAQGKKMLYSFLPVSRANRVMERTRYVHRVFGRFISGKLLDSLIIGFICFIVMSIFRMPYPLLISVIIGVTNIIPFFGPIIGAVPSLFLIFVISPMQALYFLIFVLLLQQFDGNILGPKILGDSTGLSSFWVMFAILVFGGIFGFVGMVIGVPLFAVIYNIVTERLNLRLKKRGLSTDTKEYRDGQQIDPVSGDFVAPPEEKRPVTKRERRAADKRNDAAKAEQPEERKPKTK